MTYGRIEQKSDVIRYSLHMKCAERGGRKDMRGRSRHYSNFTRTPSNSLTYTTIRSFTHYQTHSHALSNSFTRTIKLSRAHTIKLIHTHYQTLSRTHYQTHSHALSNSRAHTTKLIHTHYQTLSRTHYQTLAHTLSNSFAHTIKLSSTHYQTHSHTLSNSRAHTTKLVHTHYQNLSRTLYQNPASGQCIRSLEELYSCFRAIITPGPNTASRHSNDWPIVAGSAFYTASRIEVCYPTFLLQVFRDLGRYSTLEGYKDLISIK